MELIVLLNVLIPNPWPIISIAHCTWLQFVSTGGLSGSDGVSSSVVTWYINDFLTPRGKLVNVFDSDIKKRIQ